MFLLKSMNWFHQDFLLSVIVSLVTNSPPPSFFVCQYVFNLRFKQTFLDTSPDSTVDCVVDFVGGFLLLRTGEAHDTQSFVFIYWPSTFTRRCPEYSRTLAELIMLWMALGEKYTDHEQDAASMAYSVVLGDFAFYATA